MEAAVFVWLASIVRGVSHMFGFSAGIICLVLVFDGLMRMDVGYNGILTKTWRNVLIFLACVNVAVATILPTEKTMYMMAGAYFGQQAVQTEVASDVYKIIQLKVKEVLKEQTEKVAK